MKLKEKVRIGSKVHRKYYPAKTPYQYLMESDQISEKKKQELKKIYDSLNPAQLKRTIEVKLDNLYMVYQQKQRSSEVEPLKRFNTSFAVKIYCKTKFSSLTYLNCLTRRQRSSSI